MQYIVERMSVFGVCNTRATLIESRILENELESDMVSVKKVAIMSFVSKCTDTAMSMWTCCLSHFSILLTHVLINQLMPSPCSAFYH